MASFQDLDEAERAVLVAVQEAFRIYASRIRSTVFADPRRPDVLVWPSGLWAQLVAEFVVPVARRVFEDTVRQVGVPAAAGAATFVTSLQEVVENTHIPDRVLEISMEMLQSQEYADEPDETVGAFFPILAALMIPALTVLAVNVASNAVNAATFAAVMLLQAGTPDKTLTKTWIAHHDDRTRMTHRVADGQSIPAGDAFNVGGFPLRFPHDPFGPPQEVMNCRCRLRIGED